MIGWLEAPVRAIWRHRRLLARTATSDLRSRYAGSALGITWLVLYPLLMLGAYAAVQARVNVQQGASMTEFILLVFCGLVPFLGFAEALALGTTSVTGNASLIKNTLFPIEMVPVKAVFVSQAAQLVGTGILLAALSIFGKLTVFALLLPVVFGLQLAMTIGVIWIASSLNVFVRDLQQIVGLVTLVLMLISPIGFASDSSAAESLRWLLLPNPLAYAMFCYQDCLVLGRLPSLANFVPFAAFSAVMFFGGFWFFGRLKRVMTDNV